MKIFCSEAPAVVEHVFVYTHLDALVYLAPKLSCEQLMLKSGNVGACLFLFVASGLCDQTSRYIE